MLNTWLALKQMSDALAHGRLEEAWSLGQLPAVREHQRGGELLKQLALAYLERAKKELAAKRPAAAWRDAEQAKAAGAELRLVEKFQTEAIQQAVRAGQEWLAQGPVQRAVEQFTAIRDDGLRLPELDALAGVAQAWHEALDLAERGEFGRAMAKFDAVEWQPYSAAAAAHATLLEQQLAFTEQNAELQLALEDRRWRDVIRLADQLLVCAPHFAPARRARTLAWKELEPATEPPVVKAALNAKTERLGRQAPAAQPAAPEARPEPPPVPSLPRRFVLWVDGVGGFLVCLSSKTSIGQASEGTVDIPLFADISRLHAYISRDSEGYLLEAIRPATVNGKAADRSVLRDGDLIGLGASCQLRFLQPVAISNTVRLEIKSRHKLPLSLDGVVLMDETLLLGDTVDAHVRVPGLRRPVALLRRRDELLAQTAMPFEIDGKMVKNRGPLTLNSTVSAPEFRLALEPLGPQFGRVRM